MSSTWPAFDETTRHGCLSPSSARAYTDSSSHQNFASNRSRSCFRLGRERVGARLSPERRRQQGSVPLGAVHIGLHLAQRDRSFRSAAVAMENRVVRILPSLIREAVLGLAVVFDEAVAVAIPVAIDPSQRGFGIRPQRAHRLEIAGADEIFAEQQHEQRRCIDASVVASERHFAQIGHLAVAHLVQDLCRVRRRAPARRRWPASRREI